MQNQQRLIRNIFEMVTWKSSWVVWEENLKSLFCCWTLRAWPFLTSFTIRYFNKTHTFLLLLTYNITNIYYNCLSAVSQIFSSSLTVVSLDRCRQITGWWTRERFIACSIADTEYIYQIGSLWNNGTSDTPRMLLFFAGINWNQLGILLVLLGSHKLCLIVQFPHACSAGMCVSVHEGILPSWVDCVGMTALAR